MKAEITNGVMYVLSESTAELEALNAWTRENFVTTINMTNDYWKSSGLIVGFGPIKALSATAPVAAIQPAGDAVAYRVAEFWSSANPGKKIRMLAEGANIVQWAKRGDFIRWVDAAPVQHDASERELDLYDEIECDLPALFGRASNEGHEAGQVLAMQVRARMKTARARAALASEAKADAAPVVPRVPTDAMLIAARDWAVKTMGRGVGNDAATGCWQAMFDAATPPATVSNTTAGAEQREEFEQLVKQLGIYTCNFERWDAKGTAHRAVINEPVIEGNYVSEVLQACWKVWTARRAPAVGMVAAPDDSKFTVDGKKLSALEYIDHLHDEIHKLPPAAPDLSVRDAAPIHTPTAGRAVARMYCDLCGLRKEMTPWGPDCPNANLHQKDEEFPPNDHQGRSR